MPGRVAARALRVTLISVLVLAGAAAVVPNGGLSMGLVVVAGIRAFAPLVMGRSEAIVLLVAPVPCMLLEVLDGVPQGKREGIAVSGTMAGGSSWRKATAAKRRMKGTPCEPERKDERN